jgi:hypothetical protein
MVVFCDTGRKRIVKRRYFSDSSITRR